MGFTSGSDQKFNRIFELVTLENELNSDVGARIGVGSKIFPNFRNRRSKRSNSMLLPNSIRPLRKGEVDFGAPVEIGPETYNWMSNSVTRKICISISCPIFSVESIFSVWRSQFWIVEPESESDSKSNWKIFGIVDPKNPYSDPLFSFFERKIKKFHLKDFKFGF